MSILNITNKKLIPALYIIVDIGIPTPSHVTENVLTTVQNVVCLGKDRIPAVGVALINSSFQQVVSLTSTETELHKILRAIKSVINVGNCRSRISMEDFKDCIFFGIKRALEDFHSLPNKLGDREHCPSQLQIAVFSKKNGTDIQFHVEQIVKLFTTDKLKKVQVIELDEDYLELHTSSSFLNLPQCVDLLKIPGSTMHLGEFMKQWLTSWTSEREHVRILLQDCQILCDIQECLLQPGVALTNSLFDSNVTEDPLRLEVTHRLSVDGLCESQLFGSPLGLVPTRCSQLNLADKHINQQYFSALSQGMPDNEYLVAKSEEKKQALKYYVIIAGEGLLLLKSLVTAEMSVMPAVDTQKTLVIPEVEKHVTNALWAVPTIQSYRPSDFPTGLYQQLKDSHMHLKKPQKPEPLCKDPAHESYVVGIEIKKTTKRKKSLGGRTKRNPLSEIPLLTKSDQQTITALLSRNQQRIESFTKSKHNG